MPKIKYMGTADNFFLDKGETVGNRVAGDAVLTKRITFNKDNGWVVDTDEAGVHPDFVEALLEADPDRFKNISGMTKVPSNQHEMLFLGHKKSKTVEAGDAPAEKATDEAVEKAEAEVQDRAAGASEASDVTTTVGGSTSGATDGGGATTRKTR